jgi:hypothetical protein
MLNGSAAQGALRRVASEVHMPPAAPRSMKAIQHAPLDFQDKNLGRPEDSSLALCRYLRGVVNSLLMKYQHEMFR